jgi:ribosomal-protein-alanine N-acetyltransferase
VSVTALAVSMPRLELTAATALSARADVADKARFGEILRATIPEAWPPPLLADVQEYFAAQLEKGAAVPGWWNWYAVLKTEQTLVGTGGFAGQPDSEGTVTLGYSVVPGFEGQGYATELVSGLLAWFAASKRGARVHATTFERHYASVRVLEKNGFVLRGVSSEDESASDADRQGRGRLMLFVRTLTG